ncbi:multiple sugar transport system substrate-binding protein [Demequina lutea]|uniref:Multiple sugar transport system substrate-binding protein n=1 Tax=Demequina lutea TaxID=431489 RepID=A0A7Y9Z801_9MICO|nr:multiple sugar transport system substrate-binding protein [Demequina lutea]
MYDDAQQATLYNVKLNAGSSDIDVLMFRPLQNTQQFTQNGWFADLTKYVNASTDWNWNDFWQSARDSVTVNNKIIGVPLVSETGVLYYRKDLLAETGMPYPKTMDDLKAVVAKIHELHPDIFAFAGRGEVSAAVTQFSSFLYSMGGNWTDGKGNSTINSDAAKAAYKLYGGLIHDYGPPGETDMNWPQVMGLLQQGLVAFYPEASSNYDSAVDPTQSKVADQIGVGPIPAGPAGSKPYNITAMALGISAFSKHKDAAWAFIKWATNQANSLTIQEAGVPGARTSVWNDPKGTSTLAPDLLATIQGNSKIGVGYDRPQVVNVDQARQIVGAPIVAAIQGGDSNAVADQANSDFQALLDGQAK